MQPSEERLLDDDDVVGLELRIRILAREDPLEKSTTISVSLPSAPRRLMRTFFEALSVRPPAFAITESSVSRSSPSNSARPET